MKRILYIVITVMLGSTGISCFYQKTTQKIPVVEKSANGAISSAMFHCTESKTIRASFFKDRVELILSDGRDMLLPQAVSADGARYANADGSFVFWNKGDAAFIEEGNKTTFKACVTTGNNQASAQLANPASVNCIKLGGNLVIRKRGDGGEYGVCYFIDNRACEEWALFHGDCPPGGVKTTGFVTIDQKYCVWSGGRTLAVPDSMCIFKDGSRCSTIDFYNGKCSASEVR